MAAPKTALTLESLGIRAFYGLIASVVSESMLPRSTRLAESKPALDQATLAERTEGARYFGWANVVRGAFYLPPLYFALEREVSWLAAYCGLVLLWHALCVALEAYKSSLYALVREQIDLGMRPDPIDEEPPPNPTGWWAAYTRPKRFETRLFYRLLGIERIQELVLAFIERTRLTPAERKAGKKVQFLKSNSREDVRRFEHGTRVGESMHLLGLVVNAPLAIGAFQLGWYGVGGIFAFLVFADAYLVLLQRFHRLRVWKTLEKAEATW